MDEQEKKQPWGQGVFGILMFLFLGFMGLSSVIMRKEPTLSEQEQRMLSGWPTFTTEHFFDGQFQDQLEEYLGDQAPGRKWLFGRYREMQYLAGMREFNGYLIGKDNSALALDNEWPEEYQQNLADLIAKIGNDMPNSKQVVCIAPEASSVESNRVPLEAYTGDGEKDRNSFNNKLQEALADKKDDNQVQMLPVRDILASHTEEQLYYYTDHHWTTRGAYYVAEEVLKAFGKKLDASKYEWECVKTDFYGTTASGSGLRLKSDTIELCIPKDERILVNRIQEQEKMIGCFQPEALDGMQPYEVFFGGNFGELEIRTDAYDGDVLLVIKDSFANCLLPILMPYYREIVVIDPRYYTGEFDSRLMGLENCDILWLYRGNTLAGMDVGETLAE